ncbi:hypothetical protein AA313_de0202922 [Arthrobotrys entomopaga]|nr:hypothetical protein AA313_de0202922 [Arthrobotrys entomopaga]
MNQDNANLHVSIQTSLSELSNSHRADDYRMQSLLQDKTKISTGATFFDDLQSLEAGARPTELRIWSDDQNSKILGLCVVYTTATEIAHGKREGNAQKVIQLDPDEVITEVELNVIHH